MSQLIRRFLGAAVLSAAAGSTVMAQTPQGAHETSSAHAKRLWRAQIEAARPDSTELRDSSSVVEFYGFAMTDAIYEFGQSNPDWFDTNRPSRLPSFDDQYGHDNRMWFSARQSRIGAKATFPARFAPFIAVFEWDLFGVSQDAGQTTIRPRHMYGQWGQFGAGQTNSIFMDVDVFPNTLEYWGPNGMLFFRNVMVWWQPVKKKSGTRFTLALERPGASGDAGIYADRIELQNVHPRFPAPDVSSEFRYAGSAGYLELAGIVRWIYWDDLLPDDDVNLDGHVTGWGTSLSSNWNMTSTDVLRTQVIYGAGVENYFNDAPIDVGLKANPGHPFTPVTGEALKDFGMSAYIDHRWGEQWTSSLGYSRVDIDNSDLQAASAYKSGQYASTNLLWNPMPEVVIGGELLWGHRDNNSDGFKEEDYRFQFSFKYSFSQRFGGSR